jgi:transposase
VYAQTPAGRVPQEIYRSKQNKGRISTLLSITIGSNKTKHVKRWLAKHPRFHMHFTPTSASWLNMVERFFSEITTKKIRRGIFKCVETLIDAIMDFVKKHNENPKIFTWTKDTDIILAKAAKCTEALGTGH